MFSELKKQQQIEGRPENLVRVDELYVPILRLWLDAGLLQNKQDGSLKHNAWEHMAAGSIYTRALGQLLGLKDTDIAQLEEAYRKHDMDKDTETAVVNIARCGDVSWEAIEEVIRNAHPIYDSQPTDERIDRMLQYDEFEDQILDHLKKQYTESMRPGVDVGERVYVARDLIVGGWHDAKLAFEGTDPEVIEMQAATEYSASPAIDRLIDEYANSDSETQIKTIKKVIIYLVDNAMRNTEFVDHVTRANEVFQKPANQLLSDAYTTHSGTGETALEIQIRVGQRAVDFISGLAGIPSDELVKAVELRAQQNTQSI